MSYPSILLFAVAALLTTVSALAESPQPPEGFRAIFNGTDLSGWHGHNPHQSVKLSGEAKQANLEAQREAFAKHWTVENGELVNDGHGPYASTDEQFGDIELRLEYKTVAKADSGIYLRGTPQVQIWDWHQVFDPQRPTRKPHLGSGGLFNNTPGTAGRDPLVLADKPFGQWNQVRIRQIGAETWVWLNDALVVDGAVMENYWDRNEPLPKTGPIMLQTHGGEIRWRNIFVREIDAEDSDAQDSDAQDSGAQEAAVSRVLFGSCIKQDQPMPILQTMLQAEPQLLLFLGDNIYADTLDSEVMRAKYERLAADENFRKLRAACPTLATWDDHDYGVNDGGAEHPERDAAQQAFVDFWGDPADSPRRNRAGVYQADTFGPPAKRLQVILLDTRYFRSALKTGPRRVGGPYLPDNDAAKTMLGEPQWSWLEQQLRMPAELRVIVSSIQFVAAAAGQECWANLPHERQRLMDLIHSTKAGGVVIVSGDRHWAELSVANDAVAYPLIDLTSSSINQKHPRGTPTENPSRGSETTYHEENFGVLAIDWDAADPQITMEVRDLDNRVQIHKELRLSELQPR